MRKVLGALTCLALIAGCGSGSSGPSEEEVVKLVGEQTGLALPTCARTKNGDSRDFTCDGGDRGEEMTVELIIGEDDKSVVITRCEEAQESIYGDPCEGLR